MKSIKNLAEFIEQSNELFNKMTDNEKKVQIAKDCIQRIRLEQFRPMQGAIIGNPTVERLEKGLKKSLKEIINDDKFPSCQVCAKGGLFLSYVGRTNEFTNKDLTTSNSNAYNTVNDAEHRKLLELFTARELAYIEFCFESRQCLNYDEEGKPISFTQIEKRRIETFKSRYFDKNDRLIEICKNIIRNKGTFKLSKHYNNSLVY